MLYNINFIRFQDKTARYQTSMTYILIKLEIETLHIVGKKRQSTIAELFSGKWKGKTFHEFKD